MPICPNLAGNQMGQNYDGLLVKVLNVKIERNFVCFVIACLGPLFRKKGIFLNLRQMCKVTMLFVDTKNYAVDVPKP